MKNGQGRNKLADFKNVRFLHWKALQKVDINSEKIIMYSVEVIYCSISIPSLSCPFLNEIGIRTEEETKGILLTYMIFLKNTNEFLQDNVKDKNLISCLNTTQFF